MQKQPRNLTPCISVLVLASISCLTQYQVFGRFPQIKAKALLNNGGNYEELVIYIRNMGAVVWVIAEVGTSCLIRKLISKLTSAAGPGKKVSFIIRKLDQEMKSFIVFMSVLGSMYAVFIIPYLLPYQTYLIAFIVGLGSLRTSAKAFMIEEQGKATGAETKAKVDLISLKEHGKSSEVGPGSQTQNDSQAAIPPLPEVSSSQNVDSPAVVPNSFQAPASARESVSFKEGTVTERGARTSAARSEAQKISISENERGDLC